MRKRSKKAKKMKEGKSAKGTHKKVEKHSAVSISVLGHTLCMSENIAIYFFIFYGGEEYEEATYGRGGKNSYTICPLLILPLLLSSVDI